MSSEQLKSLGVFDDWSLYDKIIHFNYMRHREISAALHSYCRSLRKPLHVLDLGCGDGRMAKQGLGGSDLSTYVGVDQSPEALNAARANLSDLSCSVFLRQSELSDALAHTFDPRPNLILASYSLHHFRDPELAGLMGLLGKIVQSDGSFIWIDLQRNDQESRDDYLRRYVRQRLPEWNMLSDDEIKEVVDHMMVADFPLTSNEKRELAASGGFRPHATVYQDADYAADIFVFNET